MLPITNPDVAALFESYPPAVQDRLMSLRQMIYEVAARTEGVGPLEETLKWGQPSYLTPVTRSGTTIRIDQVPGEADQVALYVNCRTTLIEGFRAQFGELFTYEGTRAIHLDRTAPLPTDALETVIEAALTYHQRKD